MRTFEFSTALFYLLVIHNNFVEAKEQDYAIQALINLKLDIGKNFQNLDTILFMICYMAQRYQIS